MGREIESGSQFSARKLAFFSRTNVIIIFFAKTDSIFNKKRQVLGELKKIITSVPGLLTMCADFDTS
jgi:hypothetical protein